MARASALQGAAKVVSVMRSRKICPGAAPGRAARAPTIIVAADKPTIAAAALSSSASLIAAKAGLAATYKIASSCVQPERRYLKLIKSVRLSVEALGFKGSFVAFALF
jgi:hypothetical protein